ncbi:probable leucine-rich repeat receptor-like protein kinase At1g35710 [Lycium barbarum]|uniref:probable leucine-rich repeat receptor-like protein kinase At1g35710 n=1 Tax=Lycium barbarum TaxID=112863 RepID=UPI00293ECBC4|nr:probable leucine-rich repeat receptor-like protein kinase At1g35710 [Lycium barbarum]
MAKQETKPVLGYQTQRSEHFYQTNPQYYQTEPQFHQMHHPAYAQPCPGYPNNPGNYYDYNYPARPLPYVSPDVSQGFSFARVMLCLMIFFILFATVISTFTYKVFMNFKPTFKVESFVVRSFDISGNGGPGTMLKANWETKVSVKNTNHRSSVQIEHAETMLVYKYVVLDTSSVDRMDIERESTVQMLDVFSFPNSKRSFNGESVVSEMAKDRERGQIIFDMKIDVQIKYKGRMLWKLEKMRLFCERITLSFQTNGSTNIPTWDGSKRECEPGNNFTGVILSSLSLLRKVIIFVYLLMYQFSGEIPSSLSNLTKLEVLRIQRNFLQGDVLWELGDLGYMDILDLQYNHLTGSIALTIFNSTTMQVIALSGNNFSGKLPTTICDHLPNLEGLYLSSNILDGVIPPNMEKCIKFKFLSLSFNEFIGTIPRDHIYFLINWRPVKLGNLKKLQGLELAQNALIGSIPTSICNMPTLNVLTLSENKLLGTLPSDLGHGMLFLELFICAENNLSGFISASISNYSSLRVLDLSGNSFTGPIPESLGNLKNLEFLNYWGNNFFSDSTLSFLTSLTNCRKLRIPRILGGLDKLIKLSLAHNNRLDGPIPYSFGKMLALELLDLCYNNLGGEIPKSLEALMYLNYLNISFNKLSGEIPIGGPFAKATGQSFFSNDALCGDSKFNGSPCVIQSPKRKKAILILE